MRWRLPWGLKTRDFVSHLVTESELREVDLVSEDYQDITRFVWRDASAFEIASSLRAKGYLSHASAIFLHQLTQEIPRTIFVNEEQSPKPSSSSSLSQEGLNRAFARPPRSSRYAFAAEGYRFVLLSGKHTGRLEVSEIVGPDGAPLPVTKLERTLIDATVRPHYSGGVHKVLEAFEQARDRLSVNVLVATLRKLEYLYPYHQALGFYMTRAGYPDKRLDLLRRMPRELDFHLAHGIRDADYDPEWRLFFPKGLE